MVKLDAGLLPRELATSLQKAEKLPKTVPPIALESIKVFSHTCTFLILLWCFLQTLSAFTSMYFLSFWVVFSASDDSVFLTQLPATEKGQTPPSVVPPFSVEKRAGMNCANVQTRAHSRSESAMRGPSCTMNGTQSFML